MIPYLILLLAAAPSPTSVTKSPVASEVAAFPAVERAWTAPERARAYTQLVRRASAGDTLPRLTPGPSQPVFQALLTVPADSAPPAELLAAGFALEKVKVAYQMAVARDRSHLAEVTAIALIRLQLAAAIARGPLTPRSARYCVESLALVVVLAQKAADSTAFLERARTTIRALSAPARHELSKLLVAGKTGGLEAELTVPADRIDAPTRRLLDLGLPAPDREWAPGDLAHAIELLSKVEPAGRPRRGDAYFARLVAHDALDFADFATVDAIDLCAKLIDAAIRLRQLYTPEDSPEALACDELVLATLLAHARLEARVKKSPAELAEEPALKAIAEGSAVDIRGQVFHALLGSLERAKAPTPHHAALAEALAKALPELLPAVAQDARDAAVARIKAFAPRYPEPVRKLLTEPAR